MKAVLLDTNVASCLFDKENKYHNKVKKAIDQLDKRGEKGPIYISLVTIGEIRYGFKIHKNIDEGRKARIEERMKEYDVMDITKHTTEYYSAIRAGLFDKYGKRDRKGKVKAKNPEDLLDKTTAKTLGIQENDLWIVSVAATHNLCFATRDQKIKRIQEIAQPLYPYLEFKYL